MKRSTVERVAGVRPVAVEGIFYRHAAVNRDAFAGGLHGRWGAQFPVIYLGRPEAAPVAEAYRHLVEEAGIPAHAVQPRVLYTVRVRAQDIVDLTRSLPSPKSPVCASKHGLRRLSDLAW